MQSIWLTLVAVKLRLVVTREERDNGKEEGSSRDRYKGHVDKAKGEWDRGWEVGMGGARGGVGRK